MTTHFEQLLPGLFRAADTCNAYVLVRGRSGIAIDPGSGAWLPHVGELGIDRLDWVLLTHTHRDQCAGIYGLDRTATRLAVPDLERHLVDDVESFWHSRQVYHNYNQVPDFLSLPRSAPVDLALHDFDSFAWQDLPLEILPAPGHTPGSIAIIANVGGRRIAFVGDMIEADGRTPLIHALQYRYTSATGAVLLVHSLHHLMGHRPDLLLPGHGEPIEDAEAACTALTRRLRVLAREMWSTADSLDGQSFVRLSEHVFASGTSCCSYYAVLDGTGHALLIDAGYPDSALGDPCFHHYRTRFLPVGIDALMRDHDVQKIDTVIVTHYHDDHVIGVPYLQKRHGSTVWCYDRIAPILERPADFNMPCTMPVPIRVDRTFTDREAFEWRGVRFRMHDLPGQTDLHSGISFDLDGKRYLAMGDSAHFRDGRLAHGHVIFANRVSGRNHLKVAERMLEIAPDVLLHGHHRRVVDGEGRSDTPVTNRDLLDFRNSAVRLAEALGDLVADQPERRCRIDWVRVEPYRVCLQSDEGAALDLVAENLHEAPIELELGFVPTDGVTVEPESVSCRIEPGQTHRSTHHLRLGAVPGPAPTVLCVDVVLDGKHLGWIGHGQIWHGTTGP